MTEAKELAVADAARLLTEIGADTWSVELTLLGVPGAVFDALPYPEDVDLGRTYRRKYVRQNGVTVSIVRDSLSS